MQTIRIRQWFRAHPEDVFQCFARHEALGEIWPGRFVPVQPGDDGLPHSVGSIREVRLPGVRFREQITEFRQPALIGYRIVSDLPFLKRHYGVMRFQPEAAGTLLDYRIELDARWMMAPVLAQLLEESLKPGIRRLARRFEQV
jgi:hypothetical protein